jgi:hypothetical protein
MDRPWLNGPRLEDEVIPVSGDGRDRDPKHYAHMDPVELVECPFGDDTGDRGLWYRPCAV